MDVTPIQFATFGPNNIAPSSASYKVPTCRFLSRVLVLRIINVVFGVPGKIRNTKQR